MPSTVPHSACHRKRSSPMQQCRPRWSPPEPTPPPSWPTRCSSGGARRPSSATCGPTTALPPSTAAPPWPTTSIAAYPKPAKKPASAAANDARRTEAEDALPGRASRRSWPAPTPRPRLRQALKAASAAVPAGSPLSELHPDALVHHGERKRIHDAIGMTTYNAETALARLLAPHYARAQHEARSCCARPCGARRPSSRWGRAPRGHRPALGPSPSLRCARTSTPGGPRIPVPT